MNGSAVIRVKHGKRASTVAGWAEVYRYLYMLPNYTIHRVNVIYLR